MQYFPTREEMIRELVSVGGQYAEVGVLAGEFSAKLLSMLQPEKLVLIDLFEGQWPSGDQDGNNMQTYDLDRTYKTLLSQYKDNTAVILMKGDSPAVLGSFDDDTFDMIYIDGDHSYEGCKRDLEVALKKCKIGGWICGHDYEMNMVKATQRYAFGVRQAVDEFILVHGLELSAKGLDGCVSFAIQNSSLHSSRN